MIKFNKACVTGKEIDYIKDCIDSREIHGDGKYSKLCQSWFKNHLGLNYNLLTTSCSTALDLAALLLKIQPGDEVIMPSFTFVSTANSFAIRGAKIKFIDIRPDTMNMNENKIEEAITKKTKAIVPVHYAGIACEMDTIQRIAKYNNLVIIEDAAQGMMSFYNGKSLGSIGDIGCYSFHGTKNYTSGGEGGLICMNSNEHYKSAEIIREKGTNRSQFLKGMVDKYTWIDIGSSLLPSDLSAAYLFAQLELADKIKKKRLEVWNKYYENLIELKNNFGVELPFVPKQCEHNGHLFYLKFKDENLTSKFIQFMRENQVITPFHYVPLHTSPAGKSFGEFVGKDEFTSKESSKLVRLPLFYEITDEEVKKVIELCFKFFKKM